MCVKLVGGRLPLTGGAVGFLFRQRHARNALVHHPGSSAPLSVSLFYNRIVSFPSCVCFPFIFRTTCAPPRPTLFRDERNGRYDGNSYSSRDARSAGSEPSGDVSILFLFLSFFGTFHRCCACTLRGIVFISRKTSPTRCLNPPFMHEHFVFKNRDRVIGAKLQFRFISTAHGYFV